MSSAVSVGKWVFQTHLPVVYTQHKGRAGEQRWFPECGGDRLQIQALTVEINLWPSPAGRLWSFLEMLWLERRGRAVPGHPQMCSRLGWLRGWPGNRGMRWDGMGSLRAGRDPQHPGSSAGLPALPLTPSGTARAECRPPEQPQPCPLLSPALSSCSCSLPHPRAGRAAGIWGRIEHWAAPNPDCQCSPSHTQVTQWAPDTLFYSVFTTSINFHLCCLLFLLLGDLFLAPVQEAFPV